MNKESLGNCPLCDREMISGKSTDKHHLVPKSKGGKETEYLHKVCHQKIHSLWSEKELEQMYNNIEIIKSNEEIQKFIKWVMKKPIEFYDGSFDSNNRNEKRKYIKG